MKIEWTKQKEEEMTYDELEFKNVLKVENNFDFSFVRKTTN